MRLIWFVTTLMAGTMALPAAARAGDAADPRWSPAGRRHIVELIRTLEKKPLGDTDKSQRTEVVRWWVDSPVTLEICGSVLSEASNDKAKNILMSQAMFGAGARLLESTTKPSRAELIAAGVESALVAYRNAVKADKSYRDPLYDDLAGDPKKAQAYVAKHVQICAEAEKQQKK